MSFLFPIFFIYCSFFFENSVGKLNSRQILFYFLLKNWILEKFLSNYCCDNSIYLSQRYHRLFFYLMFGNYLFLKKKNEKGEKFILICFGYMFFCTSLSKIGQWLEPTVRVFKRDGIVVKWNNWHLKSANGDTDLEVNL